jgi:hypothetical protein
MSIASPFWRSIQAAAAAALVLCCAPACKPKVQPSGPPNGAAPKTNAVAAATNQLSAQYVSVFEELIPPKGRDPFFPNSHRRDPVPVIPVVTDRPPPSAELTLKGIVGAAAHRLAVINNAILETGESATVRVPGGRVRVKCVEIGEDFAVIQVEGEIQPKRLELRKK